MDNIKRINLSFDTRREKDRQAYNILLDKKHKTEYVIELILSKEINKNTLINKNEMKDIVKEVFIELKINTYVGNNERINEDELPDEVFNIFQQI